MGALIHKTVFFLVLIYFIGWATGIMFANGFLHGFLCLPIISLTLIVVFGSDLDQKNNYIIKTASALSIVLSVGFAFYFMLSSSEEISVVIAFIGLFSIMFIMFLYLILKGIQFVQKT